MKELEYKKGHLIVFSFIFFVLLLGLIAYNIFIHTTPENMISIFLFSIFDYVNQFLLPINLIFAILLFLFGIPFTIAWWKFIRVISPKFKRRLELGDPDVKEKTLKILARHRGKFVSPTYLIKKVNFKGTLEDYKSILQNLRKEGRITLDKDDYPYFNVMLS